MCSIFARVINGQVVVGRNFDWIQLGGNVHFVPPARRYGLKTYGLCLIEQLGGDRPFEGMNSQGLFIGMAGVHAEHLSAKNLGDYPIQLDEFGAIRFVLERAATTQQAVAMMDCAEIMPHEVEPYIRLQYFIVDSSGDFCIISGQDKTAINKLDSTTFAEVTNFPLSLKDDVVFERFAALRQNLKTITQEKEAMDLAKSISHESTAYSSVYSLGHKTISLCIERDFESVVRFGLERELAQGVQFYNFGQLKFRQPKHKDRFKDAPYKSPGRL